MFRYENDCFSHQMQRIVSSKWSWISGNWERCFFITFLYTKTSFIFYTGIIGWDNLKYIYRVFFQKFTCLLSESSVSKSYPKEWELNQRKQINGFCWEHGQLQNLFQFLHNCHHLGYAGGSFKPIFLVVHILFLSYVTCGV